MALHNTVTEAPTAPAPKSKMEAKPFNVPSEDGALLVDLTNPVKDGPGNMLGLA